MKTKKDKSEIEKNFNSLFAEFAKKSKDQTFEDFLKSLSDVLGAIDEMDQGAVSVNWKLLRELKVFYEDSDSDNQNAKKIKRISILQGDLKKRMVNLCEEITFQNRNDMNPNNERHVPKKFFIRLTGDLKLFDKISFDSEENKENQNSEEPFNKEKVKGLIDDMATQLKDAIAQVETKTKKAVSDSKDEIISRIPRSIGAPREGFFKRVIIPVAICAMFAMVAFLTVKSVVSGGESDEQKALRDSTIMQTARNVDNLVNQYLPRLEAQGETNDTNLRVIAKNLNIPDSTMIRVEFFTPASALPEVKVATDATKTEKAVQKK